jgi:hypothetical protein
MMTAHLGSELTALVQASHAYQPVAVERIELDELRQRREHINRTLEYLELERCRLEENAPFMDAGAYRRRINVFNRATPWYRAEAAEINEALVVSLQRGRILN